MVEERDELESSKNKTKQKRYRMYFSMQVGFSTSLLCSQTSLGVPYVMFAFPELSPCVQCDILMPGFLLDLNGVKSSFRIF